MSDTKCPFCNSELHKDSDGYYTCYTDNCECMKYGGNGASGSESLWLTLIRTRKALGVAVDALKEITNNDYDADWQNDLAQATLEKIKDIK